MSQPGADWVARYGAYEYRSYNEARFPENCCPAAANDRVSITMEHREKNDADHGWDLVIEPKYGLLHLQLDDLWRYRDLIYLFVRRDFVAQFKQTILGPAWFIIQPLLTTIMFVIVFKKIANLSTDAIPPILFYLSGNILWQYFAVSVTNTSETFQSNANIFGKVYFPRLVVPISIVISQMLQLTIQFLFFLTFWFYYRFFQDVDLHVNVFMLLLPVLVVNMAMLGLGCGIIVSSLTTKYRDLRFLLRFGIQLMMYATTVIFPLSSVTSDSVRIFLLANPMTPIIEAFRFAFLGNGSFSWVYLAYSFGFGCVVLFVGMIVFTRVEKNFMDTV